MTWAMLQQPKQHLSTAWAPVQQSSMQMENQKVLACLEECCVEGQMGVWLLMAQARAV